jgi:hypothetical protein
MPLIRTPAITQRYRDEQVELGPQGTDSVRNSTSKSNGKLSEASNSIIAEPVKVEQEFGVESKFFDSCSEAKLRSYQLSVISYQV